MLNEYKDKQFLAYNLLYKDIENNCVTHAYLIDENNYLDSYKMVLAFVKSILCSESFVDVCHNDSCSLCKRIDDGNYPEVKVISADGMYIKKQQIIDLQQEFSRSAVEGKKRIYIIRDCEKMRAEAANSMLKFLEEPEEDIVAILMTNNINNVLSTIISRCKVIKLNNVLNSGLKLDDDIENLVINFISNVENRGIETLIDVKDLWFSVIGAKEREKMVLAFDMMIDIYYDVMKILTGNNNIKLDRWRDKIESFSINNKLDGILKKISILIESKEAIKFNVNSNLLIDSVIIGLGGISDDSRY